MVTIHVAGWLGGGDAMIKCLLYQNFCLLSLIVFMLVTVSLRELFRFCLKFLLPERAYFVEIIGWRICRKALQDGRRCLLWHTYNEVKYSDPILCIYQLICITHCSTHYGLSVCPC